MGDRTGERTPYWQAARLAGIARRNWPHFDAWAVTRGFDPTELPYDRFCNVVRYWHLRNMKESDRRMAEMELDTPPPEAEVDDDDALWSADEEMRLFQKAAAATSGG